jgi:hypothetical protein
MKFVKSREAMQILGMTSTTSLGKFDNENPKLVHRPFSTNNHRRYNPEELLKFLNK